MEAFFRELSGDRNPIVGTEFGEGDATKQKLVKLSAPKSQRFLRFAIAIPIADPRNR